MREFSITARPQADSEIVGEDNGVCGWGPWGSWAEPLLGGLG